ncbi:ER degradation-enhancing alpha-mannosidase-like protein 3 [Madurella mycetomatis]|uniref:ER degradation-enhancing alpha-mannosidase-like protein 3 n=1 Tax=Madurella mycetomatis TaxID=100816 RepID=A0A175WFJ3_9PEZI|nr:ER degradation-enhancing alpha-mannosidase-like protein 3 [Madurella mycetomatis]
MRPPRVAILVLFFSASLFLVCRSVSSIRRPSLAVTSSTSKKSSFRSLFSFTAPFSLFPPSAAISLTEDNSTFFPARPAAFGPPLPSNGLSGQLWIGSGFTDETLQEGEGEGELGCSDIPGWEDGRLKLAIKATERALVGGKSAAIAVDTKNSRRDNLAEGPLIDRVSAEKDGPQSQPEPINDGTDDYLHQGFQQPRSSYNEGPTGSGSGHADIQSMQETAEITGKIALLSRGGCGFLEKVKWAQRRGAIALIVGDNQKGGPLIQMFARGNVDNVTIPSVFTSRTTAHLLSSLMQPGSFIEDILDENGNPILKGQQSAKAGRPKRSTLPNRGTSRVSPRMSSTQERPTPGDKTPRAARRSWISELFHWGESRSTASDHSRPPSSGQLDWVLVDEWDDENDRLIKDSLDKATRDSERSNMPSDSSKPSGDDFQIGVQDWRDPDLVESSAQRSDTSSHDSGNDGTQFSSSEASARQAENGPSADIGGPKGGSITPGSGEYLPGIADDPKKAGSGKSDSSSGARGGLLSKIFGDHGETEDGTGVASTETAGSPAGVSTPIFTVPGENDGVNDREGLWITITPTGSASPFFDTLLVLVISPLITLTVVYALLILRVKIRMRRWRAPKSVVDRLPVRTYHTVAPSPSQSPRAPSPTSSSPTTPLLQGPSRSRPRSRTTTDIPESGDLLRVGDALQTSRTPSHEKNRRHGSNEWKKYMGRQVECVVCLEEYVDGVSRVMSLPCGHEFHAECM